jgi:predicted DNA-binding transcriptional regulator YafY
MTDTPGRLLALLSLLQTPREWPGSELAERLRVTPRTIRRDVDRLRRLGYPVEATLGAAGGYRLVAGSALPPLVLDDEEAVAIAVGLRASAGHAVDGIEEASLRALTKLRRILPSRLRTRVAALTAATATVPAPPGPVVDPEVLVVLAAAITNRERVRFRYRSGDGAETARRVDPRAVVPFQRRWYLVAFDDDRADWRVFRVDRVGDPRATGERGPQREAPFADAAAFVRDRLWGLLPTYRAVATLHLPLAEAARRLGPAVGDLEEADDATCLLRTGTDTLEWLAFRLTQLGCAFEVHEPPELADHLRSLAARAAAAAGPAPG